MIMTFVHQNLARDVIRILRAAGDLRCVGFFYYAGLSGTVEKGFYGMLLWKCCYKDTPTTCT